MSCLIESTTPNWTRDANTLSAVPIAGMAVGTVTVASNLLKVVWDVIMITFRFFQKCYAQRGVGEVKENSAVVKEAFELVKKGAALDGDGSVKYDPAKGGTVNEKVLAPLTSEQQAALRVMQLKDRISTSWTDMKREVYFMLVGVIRAIPVISTLYWLISRRNYKVIPKEELAEVKDQAEQRKAQIKKIQAFSTPEEKALAEQMVNTGLIGDPKKHPNAAMKFELPKFEEVKGEAPEEHKGAATPPCSPSPGQPKGEASPSTATPKETTETTEKEEAKSQ